MRVNFINLFLLLGKLNMFHTRFFWEGQTKNSLFFIFSSVRYYYYYFRAHSGDNYKAEIECKFFVTCKVFLMWKL
jgi:hypothetical protein